MLFTKKQTFYVEFTYLILRKYFIKAGMTLIIKIEQFYL